MAGLRASDIHAWRERFLDALRQRDDVAPLRLAPDGRRPAAPTAAE